MHFLRPILFTISLVVVLSGCDIYAEKEPEPAVVLPETYNRRVTVDEHNKYYFLKALALDSGKVVLAGSRHSWNERDTYDKNSMQIMVEMVDEELHNQSAIVLLGPLGADEFLRKIEPAGEKSYGFVDIVQTEDGFIALENEQVNSMVTLGFSIVKLGNDGEFVERHAIKAFKRCDPKFMVLHSSGDLIIAGERSDFEGDVELHMTNPYLGVVSGLEEIRHWTFAMRVTPEGKVVWKKSWDGMNLNAMTQDEAGNIFLMTDHYEEWEMDNIRAIRKINPKHGSAAWKHKTVADRSDDVAMIILPDSTIGTLVCTWTSGAYTDDTDDEWYDREGFETMRYEITAADGKNIITKDFAEGKEIEYPQLLAVEGGVLAAGVDINTNTIYLWKIDVQGAILWEKNFRNSKDVSIHGLFHYGEGFIGMLLDYDSGDLNETGTSILRLTIDGDLQKKAS